MTSSSTGTSFVKRGATKFPSIPGTQPSLYNFQLLTSTGIPSLDDVLNGGVALGSVVLVRNEDSDDDVNDVEAVDYSRVFLKYFLGEGVASGHGVYHGSTQPNEGDFLKQLPEIVEAKEAKVDERRKAEDDHLQIAWRYKDSGQKGQTQASSVPKHSFNLQKSVQKDKLDACSTLGQFSFDLDQSNNYRALAGDLREVLRSNGQFVPDPKRSEAKNLLRIGISQLERPSWSEKSDEQDRTQLTAFLLALRSLMRNHLAVAIVTLTSDPKSEESAFIDECVDYVINLRSFDTGSRQIFKDMHGFLNLKKVASFNVLTPSVKPGKFIFKSLKTKFTIEKIHLPPDMTEEESAKPKKSDIDF